MLLAHEQVLVVAHDASPSCAQEQTSSTEPRFLRRMCFRFARMAEAAGASVVAVHGRTRAQKGNNPGTVISSSNEMCAKHANIWSVNFL
jgi:hypothetical protein